MTRRVSRACGVSPFTPFGRSVREALGFIDRVHSDGVLPHLSIHGRPNQWEEGVHAVFNPGIGIGLPSVDVWRRSPFLWVMTIHEIAHFLDHHAFGTAGNRHASEHSPLLQGWRDAVRATEAYAELLRIRSLPTLANRDDGGGSVTIYYEYVTDENGNTVPRAYGAEIVRYAVALPELFARSYVQYIVTGSNDARLREQFLRLRVDEVVMRHWEAHDFVGVHRAIDALMTERGWR